MLFDIKDTSIDYYKNRTGRSYLPGEIQQDIMKELWTKVYFDDHHVSEQYIIKENKIYILSFELNSALRNVITNINRCQIYMSSLSVILKLKKENLLMKAFNKESVILPFAFKNLDPAGNSPEYSVKYLYKHVFSPLLFHKQISNEPGMVYYSIDSDNADILQIVADDVNYPKEIYVDEYKNDIHNYP